MDWKIPLTQCHSGMESVQPWEVMMTNQNSLVTAYRHHGSDDHTQMISPESSK